MDEPEKLVVAALVDLAQLNAPAIHVIALVEGLAASGRDTVLLIPEFTGQPVLPLPTYNLTIERTRRKTLSMLPNSFSVFAQLPALWRHRNHGPLYIRSAPMSLVLTLAAKLFRYEKIIIETNGWLADELQSLGHGATLVKIANWIQLAEARLADKIRVVTLGLKTLMVKEGLPADKIQSIGNGTDLATFTPLDKSKSRKELNLSPDKSYLVFSGNLAPWQDLDTLFKALQQVRDKGHNIELLVVGGGVGLARFEQQARQLCGPDIVHFYGSMPPARVNKMLAVADIAVAPFTYERNARIGLSPLKIRDYAAAGKPVISNQLPGLDELGDEDWMTLTPCEDEGALAKAIENLLDLPSEKLDDMGKAARAYANIHFDWSRTIEKIKNLIED